MECNCNKAQEIDPGNKGNKKLYVRQKCMLRHKQGNTTKAKCQVRDKAMKTKVTNMLRGKERKKEYVCKVKQRQMKKIYIH